MVRKSSEPSKSGESNRPTTAENLKKKAVPIRSQPGGIDLLDTIIDKQSQLLINKYKSEQEKSAERQKLELEKRRASGSSGYVMGSVEQRRRSSTTGSFVKTI